MQIRTRFIFPIVCWNFKDKITRCLQSVVDQTNKDFTILLTDDCSDDGTLQIAQDFLKKNSGGIEYHIWHTPHRTALASYNRNLHYHQFEIPDDTIILNLDGDDFLAHENVVSFYEDYYNKHNPLLTYGQYLQYTDGQLIPGHCENYPYEVRQQRNYRKYPWLMSHMRTFKYKLWKYTRPHCFEELCEDHATMFDMAEMIPENKLHFIDEISYIYDTDPKYNTLINKAHELAESEQRVHTFTKREVLFHE